MSSLTERNPLGAERLVGAEEIATGAAEEGNIT